MKFLIDAQLPRRLSRWLSESGHEAIHTFDLPLGNRTPDEQINELAFNEEYVVISKDADFVNSHLLLQRPPKLLLISTGNIRNVELMTLFTASAERIADGFKRFSFIELNRGSVIFHL